MAAGFWAPTPVAVMTTNAATDVKVSHVHISHCRAVDLAAQAVRFGEVGDFERAGDTRFPRYVGPHNIHRAKGYSLGHTPRAAARGLGASNGNVQRGAEFGVLLEFKIAEWLLEPVIV